MIQSMSSTLIKLFMQTEKGPFSQEFCLTSVQKIFVVVDL